ncbi:MAG: helix-turn-helix transcriptional regulator [Gammaproteobacteria bacterium]|nr:helix-turn-helix transcriptional regulator [Gammaproteobacteria bacterium]
MTQREPQPLPSSSETDRRVESLIARVGERVRRAREMRGLSRRAVSEMSEVSPRYLAQLEAGEGNISIGLLQRVVCALDLRIEWMVGEDDPWASDTVHLTEQFRRLNRESQQQVLQILATAGMGSQKAQRICLIGLRGAGKSTLGAAVGKLLDVPFVELNREIEETAGMPVNELLSFYGPEGYRKLEHEALTKVIASHHTVILAVAGGIVAEPSTYNELLNHFHTVWVRAHPEEHMNRVRAQGDKRPMAGNPEAMIQLRGLLSSREPLYARADQTLDTAGRSIEQSVKDLQQLIERAGYLNQ